MSSETELAWAAGFFDGEGSIGIYQRIQYCAGRRSLGWKVVARVAGCHRGSIERFAEIIGIGTVAKESRVTKRGKLIWRWAAHDSHVVTSLSPLIPYLVIKKDQVELAIDFRKTVVNSKGKRTPPELFSKQSGFADRMKALKLVLN